MQKCYSLYINTDVQLDFFDTNSHVQFDFFWYKLLQYYTDVQFDLFDTNSLNITLMCILTFVDEI